MLSDYPHNKIDLYKLKKKIDLINTEKYFEIFLKKKFFKNKKTIKKFLLLKRNCACGSKKINFKIKIKLFKYYECIICKTISCFPKIKDKGLNVVYSKNGPYEYYRKKFIDSNSAKTIRNSIVNFRKAKQTISFFKKKKISILDFGCGNGNFLNCCKKLGVKLLYGIDTNFDKKNKVSKVISILSDIKFLKKKVDCVTLWGVIEHVNNPILLIKKIYKKLKKKGIIVIETPYAQSLLATYIFHIQNDKSNILRFLEPGRHLFFFSFTFFKMLEKRFNLSIVDSENNGLDIQTILGKSNSVTIKKKISNLQFIIDKLNMSDHLRIVLRKN